MSQDSKEWIKTRMAFLKKQAGFSFNQDLFISILLCLISGRDKHLILTAPPNRLSEVTQMAAQISRCLFGFTTAKIVCHENQNRADLIEDLFSTRDESEVSLDRLNASPSSIKSRTQESHQSHSHSRSIQTLDSKISERSQTNQNAQQPTSRNTSIKFSLLTSDDEMHATPISPVDFNLKKRDRQPFLRANTSYAQSLPQKESSHHRSRSRWSEHEDMKRSYISSSSSTRIAQALLVQGLDEANDSIQALLLELIVTKELRISNVRYNVPKPFFLVISVLPQGYNRLSISSQLMDRFFVSYNFEEDMFQNSSTPVSLVRKSSSRRFALMKHEEIKALMEKATKVHVNIDITRYVRDIVVGIRTHPRVKGGITARCSQDLVTVTKSLATLFERDYLTPDLVTIAAEKVFSHRLHVLAINEHDDEMEKEDMDANLPSDIVAEILRVIYVPV